MRNDLLRPACLWIISAALVLVIGGLPGYADTDDSDEQPGAPIVADTLPWCAKLVSSYTATRDDLDTFEQRLSVALTALHNQLIDVRGLQAQINTVVCATEADADAFEAILTANPPPTRLVARNGNTLYEILSDSSSLRLYCRALVGVVPSEPVVYELRGRVGIVRAGDYGTVNDLFNALEMYTRSPGDADLKAQIVKLRDSLTFGTTLDTFAGAGRQRFTRVDFSPASTTEPDDARTTHTFVDDTLPRYLGIPYARYDIAAEVTPGYGLYRAMSGTAAELANDDTYFPTNHADVKTALEAAWENLPDGVDAENADAATKLVVLHRWVVENIRYGGRELGTRKPTAQVLADGFGRCYELADVLVTLCRAAGIHARVVVGWAVGIGGHVWVEVQVGPLRASLTADWQAVDATCPWIGIDERYIALWAGTAPVLYLETPDIRVAE